MSSMWFDLVSIDTLFYVGVGVTSCVSIIIAYILYTMKAPPPVPGWPRVKAMEDERHWFLGDLPHIVRNLSRINDWRCESLRAVYPHTHYTTTAPMYAAVMITDEADVKHVLKDPYNYVKGDLFNRPFRDLLGAGIFNADGDVWRKQRKVASHMFAMKILRDDMSRVFCDHGHAFLSVLAKESGGDEPFDIQSLFFKYTFDAICELAFGVRMDTLVASAPHPFASAFDEVQNLLFRRRVDNPFFMYTPWTATERKITRLCGEVRGFCRRIIQERSMEHGTVYGKYPDLLTNFTKYAQEHGEPVDVEYMVDLVVNFMVAGRDTTACLLSWMVYELCMHPQVQQRVVDECARIAHTGVPSYEECAQMLYLEAMVFEALRLHPSVPGDLKITVKADTLPGGKHVPANCMVIYSPYTINRMTSRWGDDAEEFRPERWLNDDGTIRKVSDYSFPTFNGGSRTCLGRQTAVLEAKTLACMLLSNYSFTLDDRSTSGMYDVGFTMRVKDGVFVTCTKR